MSYGLGYAWLYILADGIPSLGKRVMVGTGGGLLSFFSFSLALPWAKLIVIMGK